MRLVYTGQAVFTVAKRILAALEMKSIAVVLVQNPIAAWRQHDVWY